MSATAGSPTTSPTTAPASGRVWGRVGSVCLIISIQLVANFVQPAIAGKSSLPPQVGQIDALISRQWSDYELQPSNEATDGEWCRRVFLDLIGRVPRPDELTEFRRNRSSDRKQQLVRQLLYGDDYRAAYANHWSSVWTNLLIGRTGGTGNNAMASREGLQKYLRDAFANNRTYDQLVHQLVTARGETVPGTSNFNGAVNFLAMKLADDAVTATADVSRIFLGKQVQCTQCHNHPFNEWKQNRFWELNAFFRQTAALRRFKPGENDIAYVELTDQDFGGEGGGTPREAEVFYEVRNGRLEVAYPAFVDGTALQNRSGLVRDVNRRQELAKMILDSDDMPTAIVNRMWKHFLGYGFTVPVDDMGPHNPPSHPELLEYLSTEFADHSFDLKLLIEWIVLSKPYGLSSRATKRNIDDDPTAGQPPQFSRFYLRQMSAEQLYESLLTATRADDTQGSIEQREAARTRWLEQFVTAFGTDDNAESTTFDGSITQSLMMFNGALIKQALSTKPGSLLGRLAESEQPLAKQVDYLFNAAVARPATNQEQLAATQVVRLREGDRRAALQDLWWAILNSNEFIFNH